MTTHSTRFSLLLGTSVVAAAAQAQVSTFDTAANQVLIPSVSVGSATYRDVTLQHQGNLRFTLLSARPQVGSGPGVANFDAASGLLSLPAVKVGEQTYVDVRMQADASFQFSVTAATAVPQSLTDALKAFAASYDALWATAVPANGTARMSMHDACWLDVGRNRAWVVADTDADLAAYRAQQAYQIGRKTSNVQVRAIRDLTNPDGSTRQEVDIQWDVAFQDGSSILASTNTVISGSSAGSAGCSAPQTGTALRFYGDRQLVQTALRSRNMRDERHSLSTGAALSPAVNHRRSVQFQVSDPLGHATYVIVSGPGPSAVVNNVVVPFSLKMLSPRILRSAPELSGRNGNFLNWLDDDGFRFCRIAGSGTPVAAIADCAVNGATSFDYGTTTATPTASADQLFDDLGFVAGGVYRFDVYNDDGWKTVNGHAGKTPIATYHAELTQLPYTFVEMAGSSGSGKFPKLSFPALSLQQLASVTTSTSSSTITVQWTAPEALSDGAVMRLGQTWSFHNGAKFGNPSGAFYPAYRTLTEHFPASTATRSSAFPVRAKTADQASKSYAEYSTLHTDRSTRQILSVFSLQ